MSLSPELMYAILALDTYNRGYDPGISLEGDQVGLATIKSDSETRPETNATAKAAGFYAVEYELYGDTIISYRGTNADSADALILDAWNGWTAGLGFSGASQAGLALDFYTAVTGKAHYDGPAANTLLTGHSLGGGLAGFVSSLSKTVGVGYDHMPFGLAAWGQYILDYLAGRVSDNAPEFRQFEGIYVDNEILEFGRNGDLQFLGADILAVLASWVASPLLIPASFLGAIGLGTSGLEALVPKRELRLDGPYDPFEMETHSQALLPILQFSEDEGQTDWHELESDLFTAFFDNELGKKAGFKEKDNGGVNDSAQKMLTAIAYSILDEGTLVLGNTGVRALFDDANELGALKVSGKVPVAHANPIPGLAEAIVQFAGQMALGKVNFNNHTDWNPEQGILTTYESAGVEYLYVDLAKELWTLG